MKGISKVFCDMIWMFGCSLSLLGIGILFIVYSNSGNGLLYFGIVSTVSSSISCLLSCCYLICKLLIQYGDNYKELDERPDVDV